MENMSTLQTGQAEARAPRPHAGWNAAENALLFEQAARAQAEGAPLKAVFDDVARQTGRRPNSVRNYYHARVKEGGGTYRHTPAFIPFTEAETRALLEAVLSAQAAGESVRACTLRLEDARVRLAKARPCLDGLAHVRPALGAVRTHEEHALGSFARRFAQHRIDAIACVVRQKVEVLLQFVGHFTYYFLGFGFLAIFEHGCHLLHPCIKQ